MRATITNPALAGAEVVSPAFLFWFWFFTEPGPGGTVTLRRDFVGCIIGLADLKNMGAYGAPPSSNRWSL